MSMGTFFNVIKIAHMCLFVWKARADTSLRPFWNNERDEDDLTFEDGSFQALSVECGEVLRIVLNDHLCISNDILPSKPSLFFCLMSGSENS